MTFLFIFLCAVAALSYRKAAPMFVICIAFIIAIFPIVTGTIVYSYTINQDNSYIWLLFLGIAGYLAGALIASQFHYRLKFERPGDFIQLEQFIAWKGVANFCLLIAIAAIPLIIIGFSQHGIAIGDTVSVRQMIVSKTEGASDVERLAAITTWACFFCVMFGAYFRRKLGPAKALIFMGAGMGAMLASLTAAGRQSIMQLILILFFLQAVGADRMIGRQALGISGRAFTIVGSVLIMVFITISRGSAGLGQGTRSQFLLNIFRARLDPDIDSLLLSISPTFHQFMVESMVYLTGSIPLFSISSKIEYGQIYFGAVGFPFIFRQLEPILGVSPERALDLKRDYINAERMMGSSWDTGLSSPILDFGIVGMVIFLLVQGYLSQWAWMRAKATGEFGAILLSVLMMTAAAYLPFLPLFSDTNMFLLLIAGIAFYWHANSPGNQLRSGARAFKLAALRRAS